MSIETLWFILLAVMITTYVVLDGFDLGAGALNLWVAKTPAERDQLIRSLGPIWDGNEVWLVAGGGVLFFAFPTLYALSFSGFYLPLMMVLWFLVFRALGIEMRHYYKHPLWAQFWDVALFFSSFLLILFFGAALGNVVRGVPIEENGTFFEPLWTDFKVGEQTGILDWYTLLVALTAVVTLLYHGALWIWDRTTQAVARRSRRVAIGMAPLVLIFGILTSAATFQVAPWVRQSWEQRPWGVAFPILALVAWLASLVFIKNGKPRRAFFASAAYLYALLITAAEGIYPFVLPARVPQRGLDVFNAAAGTKALVLGLYWWIPGMILALVYFYFLYKNLPDKFVLEEDIENHG